MQSEESQSRPVLLRPDPEANPVKKWLAVAAALGVLGGGGTTAYQAINWPWADKAQVEKLGEELIELRGTVIRIEEGQKRLEQDMPRAVVDELEKRSEKHPGRRR
jgi:hypothetical protein